MENHFNLHNHLNVHTRSQDEKRENFFGRNKNERNLTLSQQFIAAEHHGFFSAIKSIRHNETQENRNSTEKTKNSSASRRLFY